MNVDVGITDTALKKTVKAKTSGANQKSPAKHGKYEPLVSIILFVRNGMPHLQRATESILAQSYQNFEYIIQDGASTDGTVDFLKSLNDPRLKIVSEKDNGPADAFAKAMNRCKGQIIASCLADEEFLPDTLERIVAIFSEHPHLSAITGDADITDIAGNTYAKFTGGPFNLLKYLNGEYCPYWCSSFFSANALRFVGIFDERWSKHSLEFEIWCRLGMETDILYVPEIFSKYAHHSEQLSQQNERVEEELEARIEIIRKQLFGRGKYFGENEGLCDVFTLMQLINIHRHLTVWGKSAADKTLDRIAEANYLLEFNASRIPEPPIPSLTDQASLTATSSSALPSAAIESINSSHTSINDRSIKPSDDIPLHEFVLPRKGVVGKLYAAITPKFIRGMISRDAKVAIAKLIGIRRK